MDSPVLIKKVDFFSLLTAEENAALSSMFKEKQIPKGKVLFHFGDPGDSYYMVKNGMVELFTTDHGGSKISLETCEAGNSFGELSMLDGGARTATAVAVEDSALLVLSRENLISFLNQNPSAAMHMLTAMGQRFRNTGDLLRRRVTRNANEESEDKRTLSERIADNISKICGSMFFLLGHVIFFTFWITWNVETHNQSNINWFGRAPFDPFPFGLLAMSVSVEAIILSTCLLISQTRQAAKDRIRSDIEFEVNLKAELEVTYLHVKLEHMQAEILARLDNGR